MDKVYYFCICFLQSVCDSELYMDVVLECVYCVAYFIYKFMFYFVISML